MMKHTLEQLSLKPVQNIPFNAEAPLSVLTEVPTPTSLFYVRSNFAVPELAAESWRLRIGGAVERECELSLEDLQQFERREALVLLECAGNGRTRMVPVPSGVAWGLGAVSTALFSGVSLADVVAKCGIASDAVELLFVGADSGEVEPGRTVSFERSMPIANALAADVLLATHMNGEPLPIEHGFPVRVLVPGWYAVASVKWLVAIRVLTEPFTGHFQTERYVYLDDPLEPAAAPVRETRVRALVAQPLDGAVLRSGLHSVRGIAWSGAGAIDRVEVSMDYGASWQNAELTAGRSRAAPAQWSYAWNAAPGAYLLLARATDAAGNSQPLEPVFNRLGYGNNVVQRIQVQVTD